MRSQPNKAVNRSADSAPVLRLKPIAQAIALLLLANSAQAATSFSSSWFAAKGAAQAAGPASPSAPRPGTPPPLAQQQRVQQQLGRSLANMNSTVAAIAASQAAQAAGRAASFAAPQTIHNGLGGNGLNVVVGPDGKPLFVNADGPVQTDANGKVLVSIKQTADKAILNWDTFNIGRDTTLAFQQDANWAALNKVNNSTAPSQIQGQIKADGTVMILNSNGVVFSGSSQVNVRNLVAAATDFSDEQFKSGGLYNGNAPSFTNAQGAIRVEQGAQLNTTAPSSSTTGGGYVLLLGKSVDNAGTISTPRGQTVLAAGDSFTIKKGYGTDGNLTSTTRGNEVTANLSDGTGAGLVNNSGLILAASGDVTLTGNKVQQNGVALTSTSAETRGSLHLTARGSDASVTLGEGSTTAILLDASATALDSQRDSLLAPAVAQDGKVIAADTYRRDLSLVQIDSAGSVDFQKGSITLATGGQVAVHAGTRSLVRDGAVIDVSGATGVKVAMESNSIKVNIQGNEQRDASGNRDEGKLNNNDVWVDVRELVFVPAGTNGYATDRWYTAGGLLEVSGYLGTQGHSAAEWMAQGGTVNFTGQDLVTQAGSQINLSGGTLDVQSGTVQQTWLRGADGRLYELNSAPGDMLYTGIYKGYEDHSERWGQTKYFYNPLIAPRSRQEAGYTVGRDAGTLVIGTRNAVLEGSVVSDTFQGDRQTQAAQAGLDGYNQSQKAVARGGQLVVGSYVPYYIKESGTLEYALGATANTLKNVVIGEGAASIANGLDLTNVLPADRQGTLYLDSTQLSGFKLGAVKVAASEGIEVNGALQVSPAGNITLFGPQVAVNADITAHGGSIHIGNELNQIGANGRVDSSINPASGAASVQVADGVRLDASGLWGNLQLDPTHIGALPYQNGGSVTLRSSGSVVLGEGSVVDVTSGTALLSSGKLQGGKGGDVTLTARAGELSLGGELRGQGLNGGGTLTLQAGKVLISDTATSAAAGTLLLRGDFFDKGFSAYNLIGNGGLEVADDTQVDVSMPVYRQGLLANGLSTGSKPADALESWTPPLYLENAGKGVLTQRQGASLSLQAGDTAASGSVQPASLLVGKGALINVDHGQAINLSSTGQLTVEGTLNAWGGRISLNGASAPGSSIWVGEQAVLDVAARAVTAIDARGNRYGLVRNGGSIVIGGEIDHSDGSVAQSSGFVVIREGALLDASGTQTTLDIAGRNATTVASNGGSISLASNAGLYLDGQMRANSGGGSSAGGSLSVALKTPAFPGQTSGSQTTVHELMVGQEIGDSKLSLGVDANQAAQTLVHGYARIGVDQVEVGGFDTLSLLSQGMIAFDGDVNLAMGRSLNLYAGSLGLTDASAADTKVQLSAPYVRLFGSAVAAIPDNATGWIQTGMHHGASGFALSQQPAAGSFSLTAGKLLEVTAGKGLGSGGRLVLPGAGGISEQIDRRAFDTMNLISQGDLRFGNGTLYVPGDLNLAAAQIYPATGASATVHAGWRGANSPYASDRRLVISRSTDTNPTLPYSVFGSLTLGGHTIDQGGIVRAPLGAINLGTSSGPAWNTHTVNLLPGSVTSISANGLRMPYGGTVDGITWKYDGEQVTLYSAAGSQGKEPVANRDLKVGVTLKGELVDIQNGSLIDLSGGGELLGAAFVSGRGGSTDARFNPLMQYGADGFLLPALATNPVYALVPGVQSSYAPAAGARGALDPMLGQQVTIGAGVPGLPAGTYTLLPSTYALLPGAFRVEVNGLAGQGAATAVTAMRNGSWSASGVLSIAGTGIRDSLASQLFITSADQLRRYSQYNETSYADFVRADAGRLSVPRGMLEADAKTLQLHLRNSVANDESVNFRFNGSIAGDAAQGGFGSTVAVWDRNAKIELLADNGQATAGFVSLYASDLSAMNVSRLVVGGRPVVTYGQGGNFVDFGTIDGAASTIVLRSGAKLSAGEVMLVTNQFYAAPSGIEIEQGASISTLGRGTGAYDSSDGFIYQAGDKGILAVSNGRLQWLAPAAIDTLAGPGSIRVGTCSGGNCAGDTTLYSEGSIGFLTDSTFELDDTVRYGTRHLTLGVGAFNIGSADALAAASARGALAPGLALDQTLLQRLMRGDSSVGAPALETLELAAAESLNFFGSVTLSTLNEQGESLLDNLMLSTPAIYGYGTAEDRALIQTGNLIWNGTAQRPGAVVSDGAGTGSGTLAIEAQRIEFGYGAFAQPAGVKDLARLALGFANVNLSASERITANHKGSLSVYQHQGAYVEGEGYRYSGGNLNILTPLMTGEAGSVNRLTAGGAVTVTGSGVAGDVAVNSDALGAELAISGRSLLVDTTVVLPSGKLSLEAEDDLILADGALLDVAGRSVEFFGDEAATRYSWGGDILLKSQSGNISQAAGSRIDLSAKNNQAGRLTAIALGQSAGKIDLQGQVTASASGYHNAGGTRVPYQAGGVDIRAQHLGDGSLSEGFAALNQRLNQGQVFGTRSFQLKQGDLVIGDGLKAGAINVSVDGGHLSVNGTVDASGERVGSIRLAGKHGLSIGGNAVLDAHGTVLRVDSHGQIIDSPNRATVELSSGDGQLILADGARIDLRHGTATTTGHDGKARGTLELNAPRLGGATAGDIDIDARGSLTIEGAKLIAVNGVQRYDDAEYGTAPAASGRPYQVIDQDYLNSKHSDSLAFINNALANGTLLDGKLSGLNNAAYNDAFHLRPGVEIVSATPDGDIVVSGDLDLSGFRYASLNPHTQKTSVYGSGETGSLVVRAGGDLSVYGSINDGFAPPPETPDDEGWQLTPGYIAHGGDVVVPGPGVVLAGGTEFAAGKTLNYDLPVQAANYPAGTQLPTQGVLETSLTLQAGTVLRGDVHDASGNLLYAAGTLLESAVTLPADSRLGAGSVLPAQARLRAMTWPKGAPLPAKLVLSADLGLMVGALIPSETLVKLPSDAIATPLRPLTGTRQGSNWAVAEMLPEGSQSWSMRFVAGADTQAADTRAVRVDREAGTLILADTHYSMLKRIEGGGVQYWSEGNFFGATPGTPVDDWALDPSYNVCVDEVGQCVLVSWLWSEDNFFGATPGTPVDDWALDPSYNVCVDEVGQCVNIGGDGELVGLHPATQALSVLRTGTGDLDLIAGGDLHMQSLYGAYTAGMSTASLAGSQATAFNQPRTTGGDGTYLGTSGGSETAISDAYEALVNGGANSTYAAWYPDLGGNLLVRTGGDLTGDLLADGNPSGVDRHLRPQTPSVNLNHWLWRQSSADVAGVGPIPTSWWINFGTYVAGGRNTNSFVPEGGGVQSVPELVGFTGFGTLGGGNLSVDVGGDAGMLSARGTLAGAARSQGLALAVGSTGRVTADGELLLTGGGDMQVRIRGDLNPGLQARAEGHTQNVDLGGVLTNLRGDLQMTAGALGGIEQLYSSRAFGQDLKESRAYDPFTSTTGFAAGGMVLMLGDAVANLSTRGDLVLAGSGDPGRISQLAGPAYTYNGQTYATFTGGSNSGVNSWFSLWTENTAINLLSAGGNLTPSIQLGTVSDQGTTNLGRNHSTSDGRFVYPSQLNAVAAKGSIYMGASALGLTIAGSYNTSYSLLVAPSINASLSLLAGDSIYAGGYAVNQSGASLNAMPAPLRPAFVLTSGPSVLATNLASDAMFVSNQRSLFTFAPNTSAGAEWGSAESARFYAATGDIVGMRSGEILSFTGGRLAGQTWYESAGPVWIMAGRDIVNSGTPLGQPTGIPAVISVGTSSGNLFVHNDANDVSIVSAGRDIIHSSFNVAGPGTLEVSAGRNILMDDRAAVTSLGAVVAGDSRPGASIVMLAGVGAAGPDYLGFVQQYLSPDNLAQAGIGLAEQPGKVAKTYESELATWLMARYGFSGDTEQALAYFAALPAEQQRVFAREVYFAELRAGGREYNDVNSLRSGSYLRGRNAIAALFPTHDVAGNALGYQGDITMYGGAGVHTNFGGDIQILTPGGQQVFGIEGEAPPASSGVITQGTGDIQLFANGSVLLGQSRIMTTFGGDILAWSAEGDINAGRGSKTTLVYTPPKRVYDNWGNVTLSPSVPSTGAGIATLNPIAEVAPGDIDLLAPLGTIDAGEAGIRVSGNVNIAALQVINAANIQVQGESSGVPVSAVVNTGALTNASSAAASASDAAESVAREQQAASRQRMPSIFSVQVLGFGNERPAPSQEGARRDTDYEPNGSVRVLGAGQLDEQARSQLTTEEQRNLAL